MAITLVGGNAVGGAGAGPITPNTGAVGDLLIVVAYRTGSATAPSLPAGWTALDNTGGGTNAFRVGWKYATSTTDSSGTWTNATQLVISRWSGIDPTTPVGTAIHNAATGTAVTYGAITLTGGPAAVLHSSCCLAAATALTTRTGFARDIAQGSAPMTVVEHLAGASGGADSATATGSGQWISCQFEILPPTKTIDAGTLAGTGTLTAGATRETLATATTLAGVGTLTAAAVRTTFATAAALTGTATLTAAAVQTETTTATTLAGVGTLTAAATTTPGVVSPPALVGVESSTTVAGGIDATTTVGQIEASTIAAGMLDT